MAKFVLDRDGGSPMEQVHSYVQDFVTKVRGRGKGEAVGVDNALKILTYLPRPLFRLLGWTLRKMEYYGCYPKSLAADDPCYSSCFVSNLGSIKMNADYHHLFEWGNISFFMVIGEKKLRPFWKEDGSFEMRNTIKLGLTVDERIAPLPWKPIRLAGTVRQYSKKAMPQDSRIMRMSGQPVEIFISCSFR